MCVLVHVCAHVCMPAIWKGGLVEEADKEAEVIVTRSDSLSGNPVTEVCFEKFSHLSGNAKDRVHGTVRC